MNKDKNLIKCPMCNKQVKNGFRDPYDSVGNISVFHTKRTDNEYDFKCPECGSIYIFPSEPR